MATASQQMVDELATTSASVRSLAAPSLMDNILMQPESIQTQGIFFGAYIADKRLPHVASRDIGAAAARLLLDASWSGQATLPLLGPEDLSMLEIAETLSDVLGKPVQYRQESYVELAKQMREQGTPDSYANGMVEMMLAKNEGLDNASLRTATTATPTTFRQWCEQVLL